MASCVRLLQNVHELTSGALTNMLMLLWLTLSGGANPAERLLIINSKKGVAPTFQGSAINSIS